MSLTSLASGIERGGGHPLEAAFKASAINLAQELANIPKEIVHEHLRFHPSELFSAAAYVANPKCATGNDLEFLKSEMKLAYVKDSNVVLLNCYKDSPTELILKPDWQDLLDSLISHKQLSMNSKVFLAHEVLRTVGREGENSYQASGSLAAMYFELRKFQSSKILLMFNLFEDRKACWISVTYRSTDQTPPRRGIKVSIFYGSRSTQRNSILLDYDGLSDDLERDLLDPTNNKSEVLTILSALNNLDCFREVPVKENIFN